MRILLIICCFLSSALAQENLSFDELFKAGTQSYQSKNFEAARDAFTKAVETGQPNAAALTNLALVQFQLGQKGLSVALLRKALALDPDFSTSQAALKFILPQLEVKEIPHEIQLWETLRTNLLVPFPLNAYLLLTALLLFAGGWIFLGYFGARKLAIKEQKPFPSFSILGLIFSLGFVAFFTLSMLKILDFQVPRGTIVKDKLAVLSAPEEKAAPLFDLYAGLEVIIRDTRGDWAQVTYPGALTGWVAKSSLIQTTGKPLW